MEQCNGQVTTAGNMGQTKMKVINIHKREIQQPKTELRKIRTLSG
jgi:hypothetical protein